VLNGKLEAGSASETHRPAPPEKTQTPITPPVAWCSLPVRVVNRSGLRELNGTKR
jgi:hypothetical protein